MAVKGVAISGVVIKNRSYLEVEVLGEIEPRADLPRHQPGIRVWIQPSAGTASPPERILGIGIVVNKLREIREDIDLEFPGFSRRLGNGESFIVLGIGLLRLSQAAFAKAKGERMFPLFSRPFRINIGIPYHQGRYERVRHSAAGKRDVAKTLITKVGLPYEDAVIILGERAVRHRGSSTGAIVAKGDIG